MPAEVMGNAGCGMGVGCDGGYQRGEGMDGADRMGGGRGDGWVVVKVKVKERVGGDLRREGGLTVKRPRLMQPTNLERAMVGRDIVR